MYSYLFALANLSPMMINATLLWILYLLGALIVLRFLLAIHHLYFVRLTSCTQRTPNNNLEGSLIKLVARFSLSIAQDFDLMDRFPLFFSKSYFGIARSPGLRIGR